MSFVFRLFLIFFNSVLCERAFIYIKLQYSRFRCNLFFIFIDKFCFLYINRRVLDRKKKGLKKKNIYILTPEEELQEEKYIIYIITPEDLRNAITDKKDIKIDGEVIKTIETIEAF